MHFGHKENFHTMNLTNWLLNMGLDWIEEKETIGIWTSGAS